MTIQQRIYDYLPAIVIVTVLALLAATGAGIYGWSLAGATGVLAWAALLIRPSTTRPPDAAPPRWQRLTWVYLALMAFLVLVIIPLPLALTSITGLDRYTQNSIAATRLQQAAALDIITLPSLLFSATRNRAGSLRVLAILIGAFSAGMLARRMPPPGRRLLLRLLIGGGALIAAAGIVSLHIFPQGNHLWWVIDVATGFGPDPAACFVNQNHFGGFAIMLCPAAIVAAAVDISRRRWITAVLMMLCALLLGAAAPLSESRGGVVAGVASLLVLPGFLLATGHRRIAIWSIIATLAVATALALTVLPRVTPSLRSILSPTRTASLQQRMLVWRESVDIWRHHAVIGSGPNSFHTTYPMYRRSSVTGHRTHAENLYAETLADSGTVGSAIALWAVLAILAGLWRAHAAARLDPMLTFAACGALLVAGVHALVDFALYVPLYSMTLGALTGAALPAPPPTRRPSMAIISAAFLAVILCAVAPLMETRDSVYAIPDADVNQLAQSIIWAPTSQHAWFYAGRQMMRSRKPSVRRLGERFMTQSMKYDPMNYRHWRKLGEMRWRLGDKAGARAAYERAHALRDWVKVPAYLKDDRS